MRLLVSLLCLYASTPAIAQGLADDEAQLRASHAQLIQAHTEGRVDLWMEIEAADFVSVNRGHITFPDSAARREGRAAYLEGATFSTYRDLREPIVRIADDGSLGWLIAEIEVEGTAPNADGKEESFRVVWAWVELYENADEGWRLVGNASNRR